MTIGCCQNVYLSYCESKGMSPPVDPPFTIMAVMIHRTNSVIAKPQVTFSIKSADLAAPNIWLAPWPPNVESTPPPLGFWISITTVSNTQTIAMIKVRKVIPMGLTSV